MQKIHVLAASVALVWASAAFCGAQAATLNHADAAFMKQAAQAGHLEIEASRLALDKAASGEVKNFAQQMIDEHSKAAQELASLAASKDVKLPEHASSAQQAQLKKLGSTSGAKFDVQYAEVVGVRAHEAVVKLFSKTSKQAKDADVKNFASKTLPTLEHHLEMGRAMKAALGR